jgi:hypothetical protein
LRLATDLKLMNLTAIIPRLPPVVDGIGDYALSLARLLRDNVGISTRFIVTDPAWTGPDCVEHFEVRQLTSHSADELLNLLSANSSTSDPVLLHYEGYGYAQRGCPVWLVTALERWRQEKNERRLVTMFHELYATGPPWRSSFWLSPVQKNLTTRLAKLSDHHLTSLELNARILARMVPEIAQSIHHLPVFSSIVEPQTSCPLNERRKRLVVFGTRGRRIKVYRRSSEALNQICDALEIEEVVDIGASIDHDSTAKLQAPVVWCGPLPQEEVSEILLDSMAGVIDYPPAFLAKSTIFAAYCSHRMIPIVAADGDGPSADGLEANSHYWTTQAPASRINLGEGQAVADRALDWYTEHNLSAHSRMFAKCISGGAKVKADASRERIEDRNASISQRELS